MAKETMTSEERFQAAIRLEKPDRTPVAPMLGAAGASTLLNADASAVVPKGPEAQLDLEMRAFDAFGGWDGIFPVLSPTSFRLGGMKVEDPKGTNPEFQILEAENMILEDYDLVAEIGWARFVRESLLPRTVNGHTDDKIADMSSRYVAGQKKYTAACEQRKAFRVFSRWGQHPFFTFSLVRSMVKFTEDLYYHPEKVERAMKTAVDEFIEASLTLCRKTDTKVLNCTEERAGGFFYPMRVFEQFWMPYTLKIVDALWSEGIVTWFHLDTSWDKNLSYFKQLPRGSAIIDLDGTTDIFAAKEILRDHLCISSDVHPTLLSLGKPEEIEAYCKKLIDDVGGDGGLILCTGCFVPSAVKPENFRAMIETGRTYELGKDRH